VKVWEASPGREVRDIHGDGTGVAMAVAFSPDGRSLTLSGWGLDVRVLDISGGRQARKLKGHRGAPNALAFRQNVKFRAIRVLPHF
jgi:WD40 repeat protein